MNQIRIWRPLHVGTLRPLVLEGKELRRNIRPLWGSCGVGPSTCRQRVKEVSCLQAGMNTVRRLRQGIRQQRLGPRQRHKVPF
ncbi:hypothetical protein NDU88_000159 [Pleurodeles waltl]|uniref:Uncharacterized protein n=1 Tax=Pleurodeles waltl TaxID=8319 RepID=A0AAV7UP70_PLEWA|nr:hypothetical protein NDU88_000159 [Pleurodeles waltl]